MLRALTSILAALCWAFLTIAPASGPASGQETGQESGQTAGADGSADPPRGTMMLKGLNTLIEAVGENVERLGEGSVWSFVLAVTVAPAAAADDPAWRFVLDEAADYPCFVELRDLPGQRIELTTVGGVPEVVAWERAPDEVQTEGSDIWLLRYDAGDAGTSYIVSVYQTIVVDVARRRVLGDVQWRYEAADEVEQPVWAWMGGWLWVHDGQGYGDRVVRLEPPYFEDHPEDYVYFPQPTEIDLSNPEAAQFKTRLQEVARRKPNFAGTQRIVTWGCGTGCVHGAMLDRATGAVWVWPFAVFEEFGQDAPVLSYDSDSRLLQIHGALNEEDPIATHHFLWIGDGLVEWSGE